MIRAARVAMQKRILGRKLGALAFAVGAFTHSQESWACGGLFCSLANPVEQTAERIVFAQDGSEITAIIEVQYEGPSEKFAWLVPMPGTPKVNVSTVELLNALSSTTTPRYITMDVVEGECVADPFWGWADAGAESAPATVDAGTDSVTVLDQGNAGPYDYVTIRVEEPTEDAAQVAIDWLTGNGYDVGATAPELLRPYLDSGLSLIAFRLTKGNNVGAIRPVKITYTGDFPSIPIRPTAVAAQNDMGIQVYLLGEHRAVAENYLHVELNETRIDWLNPVGTLKALTLEAISEGGEHAFLTDFAGPTSSLRNAIWTDELESDWESLSESEQTGIELLMAARFPFAQYAGFERATEAAVTLPEGVTFDDFAAYPRGYAETAIVDDALFLDGLQSEIIDPLKAAQALVDDHTYLTRLSTYLSPEEMTVDPTFVYNPDIGDVARDHTATLTRHCDSRYYESDAPWTLSLADGTLLNGFSYIGPWDDLQSAPAAARVLQYGPSGSPEVVTDNRAAIADSVAALEAPVVPPSDGLGGDAGLDDGGPQGSASGREDDLQSGDTESEQLSSNADEEQLSSDPDAEQLSRDAGLNGDSGRVDATPPPLGRDEGWCSVTSTPARNSSYAGVTSTLMLACAAMLARRRRQGTM